MSAVALACPQCGAPLHPKGRFARSVVCVSCGSEVAIDPTVVRRSRFHEAYVLWNHAPSDATVVRGVAYKRVLPLGNGTRADVWLAERLRWPPERVVLKVVRDASGDEAAAREIAALRALHTEGSRLVGSLLPELAGDGVVTAGPGTGRMAVVMRLGGAFVCDLATVRQRFPGGVEPAASVWMWRRMLDVLGVLRQAGVAHGGITPEHWLVERGEHGLRLVGFGHAVVDDAEAGRSAAQGARAAAGIVASLLGSRAPGPLAEALAAAASRARPVATLGDLRADREIVGDLGESLFGRGFHPLPV